MVVDLKFFSFVAFFFPVWGNGGSCVEETAKYLGVSKGREGRVGRLAMGWCVRRYEGR